VYVYARRRRDPLSPLAASRFFFLGFAGYAGPDKRIAVSASLEWDIVLTASAAHVT